MNFEKILINLSGFLTRVVDDAQEIINLKDEMELLDIPPHLYNESGSVFIREGSEFPTLIFDCKGNREFSGFSFRGSLIGNSNFVGNITQNKGNKGAIIRFKGKYHIKKKKYIALVGAWEENGLFKEMVFVYLSPTYALPNPKKPDLHFNEDVVLMTTRNRSEINLRSNSIGFQLKRNTKTKLIELAYEEELIGAVVTKANDIFFTELPIIINVKDNLNYGLSKLPPRIHLHFIDNSNEILFTNGQFEILTYSEFGPLLILQIGFTKDDLDKIPFNPFRILNAAGKALRDNFKFDVKFEINQSYEGFYLNVRIGIGKIETISNKYLKLQKALNSSMKRELNKMNFNN